jgi:hypothetical protein
MSICFGISTLPASVVILYFSNHLRKYQGSKAWWCVSVISALDYVVRPCHKIKNKQQQQKKQNSGATSHVRLVLQVRLPQQMLIARQEA